MFSKSLLLLALISSVFLLSCQNPSSDSNEDQSDLNPVEKFESSDSPEDFTYESLNFKAPWGYNNAANKSRVYPLLVSGYWNEGEAQYSVVNQRYPAFVLSYQKNSEADGQSLGQWIERAIAAGYRIDINRVYLTGFSMGGSGSFPLARGMNKEELFFAAIIRVAGQSESDLTNEIAKKTALWYHIGLSDTQTRIDVARSALEYNRAYACNKKAKETKKSDSITGYDRTTIKLTRSGYAMFVYSEYTDMGHDSSPCYTDEDLFPWLFSHSLKYR